MCVRACVVNNDIYYLGKDDINSKDLKSFIASHVHLRFLGLVHSDVCYDESFIDPTHEDYRPELVVSCRTTDKCILQPYTLCG